jgi:hypothetical protein
MLRSLSPRVLTVVIVSWVAIVTAGMGVLLTYSFAPGVQAKAPTAWPSASTLVREPDLHTLVMVAHPRCSCTRASIAELSWVMTRLHGQLRAYVLFAAPEDVSEDWERTDLWESAAIIAGVTVVGDPGGRQAERFGAKTSGQVALYDADGVLVFKGGITPSRSHVGDNVGRQRIVSLVTAGYAERSESSVFGCPITDADREDTK